MRGNYIRWAMCRGVSRIFERGGPISLGPKKKGHQILIGGSNCLITVIGGVLYISLPRTTNLAYLDAKTSGVLT